MTSRLVTCEFCGFMAEFRVMSMCPKCRKTICRRCKHEGPLQTGRCARPVNCANVETPLPKSEAKKSEG